MARERTSEVGGGRQLLAAAIFVHQSAISGNCDGCRIAQVVDFSGAGVGTRTPDRLITSCTDFGKSVTTAKGNLLARSWLPSLRFRWIRPAAVVYPVLLSGVRR
jgi:hypothetical protein